jgi:tRNA pseudouridine55 synthase
MQTTFTKESLLEGEILAFDKPLGWTSFSLVNKIRYNLCKESGMKKLKVGHAGTLDPLATGLLILCTGKATKKISEIQDMPKEYLAEVTLGTTTPSFDLETEINARFDTDHITIELIEEKLKTFTGKIQQTPPMYSAKNINGVRAYELARKGVHQSLKKAEVEIFNFEIIEFSNPVLILKINCSKGTYIRSIARDLGASLNSGAHLSALRRTAIGTYKSDDANNIEKFIKNLNIL